MLRNIVTKASVMSDLVLYLNFGTMVEYDKYCFCRWGKCFVLQSMMSHFCYIVINFFFTLQINGNAKSLMLKSTLWPYNHHVNTVTTKPGQINIKWGTIFVTYAKVIRGLSFKVYVIQKIYILDLKLYVLFLFMALNH